MERLASHSKIGLIIDDLGSGIFFLGSIIQTAINRPCRSSLVYEQIWKIFILSFPTTAMAGIFTGALLCLQFTAMAKDFQAMGYLGGLATSGTLREIGPVLIAFMLSGRIGAYTSARIGNMQISEQIDALRCLGVNPMQEIILPHFYGIIIASFFLLVSGFFLSMLGGIAMGYFYAGISVEQYLRHIPTIVKASAIYAGASKCLLFSLLLAIICTYKGYTASGGSKGVGKAVVNTAMASMLAIVIADWLCSVILNAIESQIL